MQSMNKKTNHVYRHAGKAFLAAVGIFTGSLSLAQSAPQVSNDATSVYYRIPFVSAPTWVRVYLDTDSNAATGYRIGTIGASYAVENGFLYRYSGSGTDYSWTLVKQVGYSVANGVASVTVARADLGSPAAINLITQTDPPKQTSATIRQALSTETTLSTPQASNDATNAYFTVPYTSTPNWVRVFIDSDRNTGTGYSFNGIGANFAVENGTLYRYTGSGTDYAWSALKSIPSSLSGGMAKITVPLADLGAPAGIDFITQTDPPKKTSSKITKTLSGTSVTPIPTPSPTPVPTPTPGPAPASYPAGPIAFYGDSTAGGYIGGTATKVGNTPSEVIDENLPTAWSVADEGVNGASVVELLNGRDGRHATWTTEVARSTAKYLIFNYAINDSYESGNTPATYKANYAKVVDIARAAGKMVIIETPNPTNNDVRTKPYTDAAKQLAAEKGIPVIDQFTYLNQYMASKGLNIYDLTNDGVHPTQATYTLKGLYAAKRLKEIFGLQP